MVYELITNAMVIVIIFIMGSIVYDSVKCKCKKIWLDYLIIGLGAVWIVFYIYVLLAEPKNSSIVGQVFVRPLNVLTFLVMNILVKIRLVGRSHGTF